MEKNEHSSLRKKYNKNPFMVQLGGKMFLQPRANVIVAKGESIVDTVSGQPKLKESVLLGRRKIVDKSQFAKVYASEMGKLYELSKAGQTVFLHLTSVMDYDNKAYFNYNIHYKELGYKSRASALKGLKELVANNLIAPHENTHNYWINPTVVCKGERFAKYTEFVTNEYVEEEAKRLRELNLKASIQEQRELENNAFSDEVNKKRELAEKSNSFTSSNEENKPSDIHSGHIAESIQKMKTRLNEWNKKDLFSGDNGVY